MDYLVYSMTGIMNGRIPSVLDSHEEEEARQRGEKFRRIRSLLKHELSRRCGIPATEIHFSYGAHGKPSFPQCEFNISHSGDCLCMAFHHTPIGIDVEKIRPRAMNRLAPRFMAAEQLAAFRERGCPVDEFFACWCAAEALVKQAGDTIWNAAAYPFIYSEGNIVPLFGQAPEVRLFTPMPGYCGAIAYRPPSAFSGLPNLI